MTKVSLAKEVYLWYNSHPYFSDERYSRSWWDGFHAAKIGKDSQPPDFLTGVQAEAWLDGHKYLEALYGKPKRV